MHPGVARLNVQGERETGWVAATEVTANEAELLVVRRPAW